MKIKSTRAVRVKTAISMPEPVFREISGLAKRLQVSRSELLTQAAQEFIEKHKNQELLKQLNLAYGDAQEYEERRLAEGMRGRHLKLVEEEW